MKKFFLVLSAFVLFLPSCSPLKIVMNSKSPEGIRTVLTSDQHLFNNFDIALGASIEPRDTVLGILVTCDKSTDHGIFDKGDKMKLRLSDQSVIELDNIYHKEFDKEVQTYNTVDRTTEFGLAYSYDPYFGTVWVDPIEVRRLVPQVKTRTVTRSYALYLVSKGKLMDIISKGVIALRIEVEDDEYDMNGTGGVSSLLSQMYDCLKEGMANDKKRTDF